MSATEKPHGYKAFVGESGRPPTRLQRQRASELSDRELEFEVARAGQPHIDVPAGWLQLVEQEVARRKARAQRTPDGGLPE